MNLHADNQSDNKFHIYLDQQWLQMVCLRNLAAAAFICLIGKSFHTWLSAVINKSNVVLSLHYSVHSSNNRAVVFVWQSG